MRRFVCLLLVVLLALTGTLAAQTETDVGVTAWPRVDGNRFVDGAGTFPDVQVVDLPLAGPPLWVVLRPDDVGFRGTVLLEDGPLQSVRLDADGLSISAAENVNGMGGPPLFYRLEGEGWRLTSDGTPINGDILGVTFAGDITLFEVEAAGFEIATLPDQEPLPDAQIVINPAGQAAVYTGATDQRYVHNVLGDALEAASMLVLDSGTLDIIGRVDLPGDEVFEGLAPIWADVDEDGTDDLITTVSAPGLGAQIRVYTVGGDLLASGPAIGLSNRWRHQLAWGPFGPEGENQVVEVLTPHIGGIVGFYQYDGDGTLEIVARRGGYTSHVIGSRNLDMAMGGDFDGDGQPEIVLPTQARDSIAGLAHTIPGQLQAMWSFPLDGRLVTNLTAIPLADESGIALAAGVSDGDNHFLRVWIP